MFRKLVGSLLCILLSLLALPMLLIRLPTAVGDLVRYRRLTNM